MSAAVLVVEEEPKKETSKPKKLPIKVKLPVGAVAGMFGTTCMFPFDIVKTRLQAGAAGGPIAVARGIIQTGGFGSLYKGLLPNLVCVGPEKAIKLVVNEKLRDILERDDGSISLPNEIIAGGTAGTFQAIVTVPMELTKIQMQLQDTKPVAERQTLGQVLKLLGAEGPKGFYRGTAATLLRDIPYSVIFFPGYANIRKLTADAQGNNSKLSNLFSGTVAGAIAAGLVTPCDTIKTNLQKQGGAAEYVNIKTCYTKLKAKGGWSGLFKGTVPRMMVVGPLFGITLMSFEYMKEYMIKTGQL
jgi:hypothetical protein